MSNPTPSESDSPLAQQPAASAGLSLVWWEFEDSETEAKLAGQVFGGHHRLASLASHLEDVIVELERCGSLDQMPAGLEMPAADPSLEERILKSAWIDWHDKVFDRLCLLVEAFYVRLYELSDRFQKLLSLQSGIDAKRLCAKKVMGTIRNLPTRSDPSVLKKLEGLAAFYKAIKEKADLRNKHTHESYLSIEYYDPERGSYDIGDLLIDFAQREDWISRFAHVLQAMIDFAREYMDIVKETRDEVQAMMKVLELVPASPDEVTGAESQ